MLFGLRPSLDITVATELVETAKCANKDKVVFFFFFLPFLLSVPSLHPADSYHVWWSSESQSKCRLCPKRVNTVNRNDFLTSEQLSHQKNVNFARHLPGIRIKLSRQKKADRLEAKGKPSESSQLLSDFFIFFLHKTLFHSRSPFVLNLR